MHFAPAKEQPTEFAFSKKTMEQVNIVLAKYPENRRASATIPLLDLAQRECDGWLPRVAIEAVAEIVGQPIMRVYEVASFYSMFNLAPVGKHLVQVCRTTPCWLRGSDKLTEACKRKLGVDLKGTSEDGQFTVVEVECLGACSNAPMVQINDDYYEDLTPASLEQLLEDLRTGKKVKVGSQTGRPASAPAEGLTTLTSVAPAVRGASAPKAATKPVAEKKPAVEKSATKTTAKKPAAKKATTKSTAKPKGKK